MDTFQQITLELWKQGKRIRRAPSGWLYGNAACCHHRGQRIDRRARGGLRIDVNAIAYNCFNCGFKTVYKFGEPLSEKFKTLLKWMGADENLINTLVLEALRATENYVPKPGEEKPSLLEACDLPVGSELIVENSRKYRRHIDYLKGRGIDINSYAFLATEDEDALEFHNRVIIPFMKYGQIVGYTARTFDPNPTLTKYIMRSTTPYVFGLDLQKFEWRWAILTEGPFDALSLDGLSVMHNVCSEQQAQLINNLGKRIIVVPDLDKTGLKQNESLIMDAIQYNWSVSIPEWPSNIKDVNAAVLEYGPLAVAKIILDNAVDNPAKIMLNAKFKNIK
jgi:hypothetical protein